MTIDKAVDDSAVKGPVTTLLHEQVTTRSGPNPPNESIESIGERVADPNFVCMIDDVNDTVAGFLVQPVAQEVLVIWWLPRARWAEDNMKLLVPVFGAACDEVLSLYPASGPWKVYGWYPGVGADFAEKAASSLDMVTAWLDYFNSTPAGEIATLAFYDPNVPDWKVVQRTYGPVSTVKQMADFARWVATRP